ncbi:MAG: hypothetical protein CBC35_00020 [Planctomycetes bacterium TMED75]|nr:hypothetical protein [Planctomycetaceae bacterium]OUU97070.1 MAG: hypothetical protein CBC35_00020 [Planctomycetes bacterium TMED75]
MSLDSSENLITLPQLKTPGGKKGPARSRMSRIRFGVLILIQLLIILHIVQWLITGTTLAPIEPSESMETVKSGVITVGFIFFVVALGSTAVLGRWFCGWGCHVVLLQDASGKLLNKFGIKPKPFRSRALMFMPLVLALYMFVWPLIYRFVVAPMMGENLVWPGFSVHLTTTDFWSTFPGWLVGIPFLFICGSLTVYLLGMKGYCTYGCPYGGFFAPIDKIAVGRIRVNDDCEQCGHCTAVCTSNVQVHREVRDFGMVVDPGCMKCMDCVSVCPKDALSFGIGRNTSFSAPTEQTTSRKWDLNLTEEVIFGALTVIVFLSVYRVYGIIPLLFASGITACVVYLVYKAWSCFKKTDVRIHRWQIKRAGRLGSRGVLYLGMVVGLLLLVAHSAVVRVLLVYAEYHDQRVNAAPAIVFAENGLIPDPPILEHARAARGAFEAVSYLGDGGISLLPTLQAEIDNRIGWLLAVEHRREEAESHLRESVDRYGLSPQKAAGIARIRRSRGDLDGAKAVYLEGIDAFPQNFEILDEYVLWLEQEGRAWEAITDLSTRIETGAPRVFEWLNSEVTDPEKMTSVMMTFEENPQLLGMIRRLSVLLMNHSQNRFELDQGVIYVEKTLEIVPDNPFAFRALALGYVKQDRNEEATEALITAVTLEPDVPQLRSQLFDILTAMGRTMEAEAVARGEFP